jgi:RAMA domain-containing protein
MILTGELCTCGHDKTWHRRHRRLKSSRNKQDDLTCVVQMEGFKICPCPNFKAATAANSQGEEMTKKNGTKKERKAKGESRKPTLAPFVDAPFKIYTSTDGKDYEAQVLSTGMIRMDEKEYTSPSSAGSALLGKDKKGKPRQVDGWKFWKFNKNGDRVELNVLRGPKSPLTVVEKKPRKTRKAKEATAAA